MADRDPPARDFHTPPPDTVYRGRHASSGRARDGAYAVNVQGEHTERNVGSSRHSPSHQSTPDSVQSEQYVRFQNEQHVRFQNDRNNEYQRNQLHFNRLELNVPQQDGPLDHSINGQRAPLLPNNPVRRNSGLQNPAKQFNQYIYTSLCLPDSEESRCCKYRTICALFCHLLILAQGIAFILISVMSIGDKDHKNDYFSHAKVLSCLVGIFFILVFLYWVLVSSCTFARSCNPPPNCKSCGLYSLWFLLFVVMIALLSTLLLQIADYKENTKYYFTCKKNDSINLGTEPRDQKFCLNFVVIWALTAIILYALYHVIAFFVIAVKTGVKYFW